MVSTLWEGSLTVLVALNGPALPTEAEWAAYMALGRAVLARHGDDVSRWRTLIFSDGGVPTARQRREAIETLGARSLTSAIVTRSRLVRGVGHFFSFFYPRVRTFAPEEIRRAFDHLGVPRAEVPALLAHIRAADARIGLEVLRATPG